ncbi:hypothetical protein Clacol_003799 [Clathrus columnatus]|uniref:Uncharacterized protein n=1 Tax=Clathrus columnatus TaxID=1419009 RepID=A0AAV5AAN7_9AGAM|nr:hypothetical protein Clacol_003799 [Clathrus columnatus]
MDAVLQSHKDLTRSKCICANCGTKVIGQAVLVNSEEQHDKHSETLDGTTSVLEASSINHSNNSGTTTPVLKEKHDAGALDSIREPDEELQETQTPRTSNIPIAEHLVSQSANDLSFRLNVDNDNDRFGSPGIFSDRPSPSVDPPNSKVKPKPKPVKKSNGGSKDSTEVNGLKRTVHLQGNDTGGDDKKLAMSVLAKLPNKSVTPASPSARSGSQYSGRESPAASATHSVSSLAGHSPNGLTKPVIRRPSKPGSAEQIAKKLSLQSQQQLSLNSDSSIRSRPLDKEEGIIDVDGEDPDSSSSDSLDN